MATVVTDGDRGRVPSGSSTEAGYQFFTTKTLRTFRAVASCIVPDDADSPGAGSDGAIAVADRALANRPERDRKLLGMFLRAVEILPVFRYGRRFSALGQAEREATLRWLESSRLSPKLRQGFYGLKAFALMGYYAQADVWAELDYPGPRMDAPYYRLRTEE